MKSTFLKSCRTLSAAILIPFAAVEPADAVVQGSISAGWYHSSLLRADGTVWSWGNNSAGQLGNSSTTHSAIPVQAAGLSGVTMIECGNNHTLALLSDGTVWAWGSNQAGQLGRGNSGSYYNSALPVQVKDPAGTGYLSNIVTIAAGSEYSMALSSTGTVYAWGSNSNGQIGDGTTTARTLPKVVTGAQGAIEIEAGGAHCFAIFAGGTAKAWGAGNIGQCGVGTTGNFLTPTAIPSLSGIVTISAGVHHSLALMSDGTVKAWGWNLYGRLGDGTSSNSISPVNVANLTGVTAISAGHETSLAIRGSDKTVWAWGSNNYGRLGISTYSTNIPVQVGALSNIDGLAAGVNHTLAVSESGSVWAFGSNEFGQLADGIPPDRRIPEQVVALGAVQSLASGGDDAFALAPDGQVWSWGANSGSLGDGTTAARALPGLIPNLSGVKGLASSGFFTLACKSDGSIAAWGENYSGQLGDTTTTGSETPVTVSGISTAAAVAAGSAHSMALLADGTVMTWGDGWSGQLGDGLDVPSLVPVAVTGLGNGVTAIAAGEGASFAIKGGKVWAWGANWYGEIGNGSYDQQSTPAEVPDLSGVVAISANYSHVLALKSDGTVVAWGDNASGRLGDGTTTPRPSPVPVSGLEEVIAIHAGPTHSMAVTKDGSVWAWGYNGAGQLGNGSTSISYVPTKVTRLEGAKALASGNGVSFAIKEDGRLMAWGRSTGGLLGDGLLATPGSLEPIAGINRFYTSPAVTVTPADATVVPLGGSVVVGGVIQDAVWPIERVWYFSRGIYLGEDASAPFSFTYTPDTWGDFEIGQVAVNAAGVTSKRSAIKLQTPYDHDADGLPDWWEMKFFHGLQKLPGTDEDGDGFTNLQEYNQNTSPLNPNDSDSDEDGLQDVWELAEFADLDEDGFGDSDSDGLSNFEELALGTDPNVADATPADTDADGIPDAYETTHDLSTAVDDSLEDADGDRFANIFEYKNGSSASDPASKPRIDATVDRTAQRDPERGVFNRIQEALDALMYAPWDEVNNQPGIPRPYRTIKIKGGEYPESLYMVNIPILLMGETGSPSGPAIIAPDRNGASIYMESASVLDGLVITHASGMEGSGVETVFYPSWEGGDPDTIKRRHFANCIIRGNGGEEGGGIQSTDALLSITHCTITGNTRGWSGPGIFQNGGELSLKNTIVWGNTDTSSGPPSLQIALENGATLDVFAATPSIIGDTPPAPVPGWISGVDPKLTPAGWLRHDSPAIDTGGDIANSPVLHDIHHESRTGNGDPDLGADEYQDANTIADGDGLPDWAEFPDDGDGLTALAEYQTHGTSPVLADTDGDGMNDGTEITNGFDPLVSQDDDHDGMPDAWEAANGLQWTDDDSLADLDGDRVPNIFEYHYGTDPDDAGDVPAPTFEVNALTGSSSASDNVFPTIAGALSAVSSRDEDGDSWTDPYPIVRIRSGLYQEPMNLSGVPILVLGELGGAQGPVELASPENDVTLSISSSSVVDGLVITHASGGFGGGAYVERSWEDFKAPRRLVNCIIRGNSAAFGGGVTADECDLDLVHCTIIGNSSSYFWPGIRVTDANLRLANCVISGNMGSPSTTNRQIDLYGDSSLTLVSGAPSFIGDAPGTPTAGWIQDATGLDGTGYAINRFSGVVDRGGLWPSTKVLKDIQGKVRPSGAVPDAGADEYLWEPDADGDGMPDAWETAHGLASLDGSDALSDADGDRIPNLWECMRGTLPDDATSRPEADWIVDPGSAGIHNTVATIQEAIDLAPVIGPDPGLFAVIEISGDVFGESLNLPANKKITLLGSTGYPLTEVRGPASGGAVLEIHGESVVDGLRINRWQPREGSLPGDARGVLVDAPSARVALSNLIIHGHQADHGGGIRLAAGSLSLTQSTIFGSSATVAGNAISMAEDTALEIVNSIIRAEIGGSSPQISKATTAALTVSGSLIRDGSYGSSAADPLLTPSGWLRKTSPAIDAGVTSPVPRDIHNEARAGAPDAGADEFADADDDGLPDWLELLGVTAAGDDTDGDGSSNLTEYETSGSDLLSDDSDGDGMADGWEIVYGLNPLDSTDALVDSDGDRVPNLWEFKRGTLPNLASSRPVADRVVDRAFADSANRVATIQNAVDQVPDSVSDAEYYAVIEVLDGVYAESVVIPEGKRIALLGQAGYPAPEIRGGKGGAVTLQINGESYIDGFRVAHSRLPDQSSPDSRAIVVSLVDGSQQAAISNLVVHTHRASSGAAIAVESGTLRAVHCTVYDPAGDCNGTPVTLAEGTSLHLLNSIVRGGTSGSPVQIEKSSSALLAMSGSFLRDGAYGASTADPLLTPEGWLKTGSPAINFCLTAHTPHDIHGETRSGNPDAGADEFRDADSDGLPDWHEAIGYVPPSGDTDSDGYTQVEEYYLNLDGLNSLDQDGDLLDDGEETYVYRTSTLAPDSDMDAVSDWWEIRAYHTDPNSNLDTDEDEISDDREVDLSKQIIATFGGGITDVELLAELNLGKVNPAGDYTGTGVPLVDIMEFMKPSQVPPSPDDQVFIHGQGRGAGFESTHTLYGIFGEYNSEPFDGTSPYAAIDTAAELQSTVEAEEWRWGSPFPPVGAVMTSPSEGHFRISSNQSTGESSYVGYFYQSRYCVEPRVPLNNGAYKSEWIKLERRFNYFGPNYEYVPFTPDSVAVNRVTFALEEDGVGSGWTDVSVPMQNYTKYRTSLYPVDIDVIDHLLKEVPEAVEDVPGKLRLYLADNSTGGASAASLGQSLPRLVIKAVYTSNEIQSIRLVFDTNDRLKLYKNSALTQEVDSLDEFNGALDTTLYIKALSISPTPGDVLIKEQVKIANTWYDADSLVCTVVPPFDADMDSDNNGAVNSNAAEEQVEDKAGSPGKIINISPYAQPDLDGIPDSTAGLAELSIQTVDRPNHAIRFSYSASDPSGVFPVITKAGGMALRNPPGALRLWKKVGNGAPTALSQYIRPGRLYTMTELGVTPGGKVSFYVQPVSKKGSRQRIAVTSVSTSPSANLSNAPSAMDQMSDSVIVSVVPANLNIEHPATGPVAEDDQHNPGKGGLIAVRRDAKTPVTKLVIHSGSEVIPGLKYRLKFAGEGTRIKVWKDAKREHEVLSETTLIDAAPKVELFLEGCLRSGVLGAETITLQLPQGSATAVDIEKIHCTVVEAEFDVWLNVFVPAQWTDIPREPIPHPIHFDSVIVPPPPGSAGEPVVSWQWNPKITAGDDRGFTDEYFENPELDVDDVVGGKSSRAHTRVTVIPFKDLDKDGIKDGSSQSKVGNSHNYVKNQSVPYPDQAYDPSGSNDLLPSPVVSGEGRDIAGMILDPAQSAVRNGPTKNAVRIKLAGTTANPILLHSAEISWDFTVNISVDGDFFDPRWELEESSLDGFPAYELYVRDSNGTMDNHRGTPIYQFDPGFQEFAPLSLFDMVDDVSVEPDSGDVP